jgi:hypothetical protein
MSSQTEVDLEMQANIRDEIPHFSGRKLKAAGCRSLSPKRIICMQHMCGFSAKNVNKTH